MSKEHNKKKRRHQKHKNIRHRPNTTTKRLEDALALSDPTIAPTDFPGIARPQNITSLSSVTEGVTYYLKADGGKHRVDKRMMVGWGVIIWRIDQTRGMDG